MASRRNIKGESSFSPWWKAWLQPSTFISLLALGTSWYTIFGDLSTSKRQLGDIQASIRILAAGQSSSMQSAIENALRAQVRLPQQQVNQAQLTLQLLTKIAPNDEQTWRAAAMLISYRSLAFSRTPFSDPVRPACQPDSRKQAGADIPVGVMARVMAENPQLTLISSCTEDLETLGQNTLNSVLFLESTIVYHGGSLPAGRKLIFYNCIFKFNPLRQPTEAGQRLIVATLEGNQNEAIEIKV